MDATCAIQASIHVFSLVRKYVSRILGTYQKAAGDFSALFFICDQKQNICTEIWLTVIFICRIIMVIYGKARHV